MLNTIKAMVFPVLMYGCVSWTLKKVEHQRSLAFELWCWRRLLRVPWTARRSNQSILKEINLNYSLEGLMLKLKFQYFGHLVQRTDSLENTLILGKTEDRRRREKQRMRRLDDFTISMAMRFGKLLEVVKDREAWCSSVHGVPKSWTWFCHWTPTTCWKELAKIGILVLFLISEYNVNCGFFMNGFYYVEVLSFYS